MRFVAIEPDDVFDAEDGRRVVLVDQDVVVVSPMAAVLLDVVAEGETDLPELARRLVDVFGPPPPPSDVEHTVRLLAGELAERDLLEIVSE